MRTLWLFLSVFIAIAADSCRAQQAPPGTAIITGTVIDARSGEPLQLSNVYLVDTFLGSATDENGRYTIRSIPPGPYMLMATFVLYEVESRNVRVAAGDSLNINFRLKERVIETDEVVVTAETPEEWKRNLKYFEQEFFGSSPNAVYCKILNPEVLSFTGSRESGHLEAVAADMIKVENRALGYILHLVIDEFIFHRGTIRYRVYPRFEMSAAEDRGRLRQWENNRAETYAGSLKHFFRALGSNTLEEEGFSIFHNDALPPEDYFSAEAVPDSIVFPGKYEFEKELYFSNILKVVYERGEVWENKKLGRGYRDKTLPRQYLNKGLRKPVTWLAIRQPPVIFDNFGYVYDPYRLMLYGDWAMSRIADALPRDYVPIR